MKNFRSSRGFQLLSAVFIICLAAVIAAAFYLMPRINEKYPWLWMYVGDSFAGREEPVKDQPVHVMFLFTDHFEPDDQQTLDRWFPAYQQMAAQYKDADGNHPQHTWFWFFSESDNNEKMVFLNQLSQMVYDDYGEVELHLHHFGDTAETLKDKMNLAIQQSNQNGSLITAEPQPRTTFGFIHGRWSLDNSRGAGDCGVNNELQVLSGLGAYADFTHPSWGKMHPHMVNRIYYADDDPEKPKSYDWGNELIAGKPNIGDLLMFTGQSVVNFNGIIPVYDHGEVDKEHPVTEKRIDTWINKAVHVKGRPEWIFVKVFAHSDRAKDHDAVLGSGAHTLYGHLSTKYNDGKNYILHFVSAREAYNIAMAAAAGMTGNPNDYRDYLVKPYVNEYLFSSVPYEVRSFGPNQVLFRLLAPEGAEVGLRFKAKGVLAAGDNEVIAAEIKENETLVSLRVRGQGRMALTYTELA